MNDYLDILDDETPTHIVDAVMRVHFAKLA
jgi:hypothetical protein